MNTLTKYQASKIAELICPLCNGELFADAKLERQCRKCGMVYPGQEKGSDYADA